MISWLCKKRSLQGLDVGKLFVNRNFKVRSVWRGAGDESLRLVRQSHSLMSDLGFDEETTLLY